MRTTISIAGLVYAAARRRMGDLNMGEKEFSKYVEALIRDDYKGKRREIGAIYDLSELEAEAKVYLSREKKERQNDLASKRLKGQKDAVTDPDLTQPSSLAEKGSTPRKKRRVA